MSCLQFSVFCNVVSASVSDHYIFSIMLLRVEVMHPLIVSVDFGL